MACLETAATRYEKIAAIRVCAVVCQGETQKKVDQQIKACHTAHMLISSASAERLMVLNFISSGGVGHYS